MITNLYWAPKAEQDYDSNLDHIILEFGIEVTLRFIDKVDSIIDLIMQGNVTFLGTEYKDVYKIVIVPKITLFYRINQTTNTLELLRFWNNKRDPKSFNIK